MYNEMKNLSLVERFNELKPQAPKSFLLFFVGDFIEFFGADAGKISQLANLTLTRRTDSNGQSLPMCGMPYHSASSQILSLCEQGYAFSMACGDDVMPVQSIGVSGINCSTCGEHAKLWVQPANQTELAYCLHCAKEGLSPARKLKNLKTKQKKTSKSVVKVMLRKIDHENFEGTKKFAEAEMLMIDASEHFAFFDRKKYVGLVQGNTAHLELAVDRHDLRERYSLTHKQSGAKVVSVASPKLAKEAAADFEKIQIWDKVTVKTKFVKEYPEELKLIVELREKYRKLSDEFISEQKRKILVKKLQNSVV